MKKKAINIILGDSLTWISMGLCGLIFVFLYGHRVFLYPLFIDEMEHMQSAWMISQGMIPFRDFFQHHHPLLWYITAPFLSADSNVSAFLWARFLCLLTFVVNCCWVYHSSRQLDMRKSISLWSVFFYVTCSFSITQFAYFRPDHFMLCMMLGGTYFLLRYLKEQQRRDICLSFLFFFISLAFLQKVVLFFIPLSLLMLLLLWDKKIKIKDCFIASIVPCILALLYVIYLWHTDSLKDYFELNWLLNKAWFRDYDETHTGLLWKIYFWGGLIGALILTLKKESWINKFFLTLSILYIAGWYACPKPYPYYYMIIVPFLSIVWALLTDKYILGKKTVGAFGILIVGYIFLEGIFYFPKQESHISEMYKSELNYILSHSQQDEKIVNFAPHMLLPFRKPVSYYWFALARGAYWDTMLFNRAPLPDLNQAMLDEKVRFVYVGTIYNNQYTDNSDTTEIGYEPDEEILNRYYQKTHFPRLYERKPTTPK